MGNISTSSRIIKAPQSVVQGIIADVGNYPSWARDMKKVVVLDDHFPPQRAQITVEAVWIKETYELSYHWGQDSVEWELVNSQLQKSQNGAISYRATPEGCEVHYSIAIELKVPLIPVLRRKIQEHVVAVALDSLQEASESATEAN